ncbi:helix-turn-helix domain-containing protein [Sporosarcina psychrophila]|uniref:Transcriptional regulator with XRE-family HTH domain n=1 Tax=Sporosarcina psychrophila TaxID=1476 RepID=A0ABV2KB89_SPOPS
MGGFDRADVGCVRVNETAEENRRIQHIAEKVKFLRTFEGMNLKDLAAGLKMYRERIMNLEIGVERADLQDVIRYCDYFGLDYEGFLFDAFPEFKAAYIADSEKMMRAIGYKI